MTSRVRPVRLLVHANDPDDVLEVVSRRHADVAVAVCRDYAGVPAVLETFRPEVVYSVRFAGTPAFPRASLVESPTVRWISVGGSGTDHLAPWDPTSVTVTNTAGVAASMVAQYALGAMLSFSLRLPAFDEARRRRQWSAGQVEPVAGKTVLIVGLGRTGRALAALCKALGMTVIGTRARPQPMRDVDEIHGVEALPSLLPRADFVVLCVPLLPTTRGLIDARALAAMRPSAVLIDVSRGGVVDEEALVDALRSGGIAGAALDVFATEPLPAKSPLWDLPNMILTPHCSSIYAGWERRAAEMFCDNLDRWREDLALDNVVDPARGY